MERTVSARGSQEEGQRRSVIYSSIPPRTLEKNRRTLDFTSTATLEANVRFCTEHNVNWTVSPKILSVASLPERFDVYSKLFEGRRRIVSFVRMNAFRFLQYLGVGREGIVEVLDRLEKAEGDLHITPAERVMLNLRFGLSPDQPEPLTLREFQQAEVSPETIMRLEDHVLLSCRRDELAGTKAYDRIHELLRREVVEVEVPPYVIQAGVLTPRRKAPSKLLHEVKRGLIENAGLAVSDRLLEKSVKEIVREDLKIPQEQETAFLMEIYRRQGISNPTEVQQLRMGNPDRIIENVDWCRRHGIDYARCPMMLVGPNIESTAWVLAPAYGAVIEPVWLDRPALSRLVQNMPKDKLQTILDFLEGGDVPGKYRITADEREILGKMLGIEGEPVRITELVAGRGQTPEWNYVRWLEDKFALAFCSEALRNTPTGERVDALRAVHLKADVSDDEVGEMQWLLKKAFTKEERVGTIGERIISAPMCRKLGWHPELILKKRQVERAFRFMLAVKDGKLRVEDGRVVLDADASFTLSDAERKALLENFPEERQLLSEDEENLLKLRCYCQQAGGWKDLSDVRAILGKEVTESRISQIDASAVKKLRPFLSSELDPRVFLPVQYGSLDKIPPQVLDEYNLEFALEYAEHTGKPSETASKITDIMTRYPRTPISQLPKEELLAERMMVLEEQRTQFRRMRQLVATKKRVVPMTDVLRSHTLAEIPREDYPEALKACYGGNIPDDLLLRNRFRKVEVGGKIYVEDIPYPEFRKALLEHYHSPLNIPGGVLSEHGLCVTLRFKGEYAPLRDSEQHRIAAEKQLNIVEPKEIAVEEEEEREKPAAKPAPARPKPVEMPSAPPKLPEPKIIWEAPPRPAVKPPKPPAAYGFDVKDSPLAEVSRVDEVIEAVKQLGDVLAEYASVRPSDKENRSRYDRILACILTHSPVRDRFFRGLLKEDQKRVNLTPADELQKILENVTPAYYTPEFCESLNKAIIKVCQYTLPEIKANPQLVLMYADDFAIALMDTAVWERDRINAMSGGEIKRMLASLRSSGIEPDFSDWRLWKERHARRAGELASKAGAHVGENTVDNARRLIKKLVKSPAEEQAAAKKKADELRVVADAFRAVVDSAKRPRQLALPARSTVEDVNTRMAELDRILRKEAEAHERVISEGKEKLAETPVAAGKPETEMIYQARVLREAKERATQLQAADAAAKAAQEKRVKEAAQPLSGILVAATVDCRNPYELLSKAHKDAGLTTIRIATTARSLLGLKTISEDVYNQGLDILRTVIAIRINPSILPQVKTKLEDELLRWFDTPPRQEELPQLAFVKAIADIGKREDLPDLSNLAKDAEAVAVGLPPALNTEYEKIEKAYLEFVKSIYEQPPQPIKR